MTKRVNAARVLAALMLVSALMTRGANAQKGVMLLNRIGPTSSTLYVSNADGSAEHPLVATSGFDYHASWSADRQWVVFTSERAGLGQADIHQVATCISWWDFDRPYHPA